MKHFNYKIIILMLFLLIIPHKYVNASSVIVMECPNKGNPGNIITCNLKGTSDKPISSLSAKISVNGEVEFVSFTTNSIWEGNGNNGVLDLYTDVNKTSLFEIGTVTLKLGSNSNKLGTVIVSNIIYYDDKFTAINVDNVSKEIKIASINNNLASLSIDGYSITPTFSKDVLEYRASVLGDKVIIEGVAEDDNATISGLGSKTLAVGTNNFSVIVASESGSLKEYKLIITRLNDNKEEIEEEKKEETENVEDEKGDEENKFQDNKPQSGILDANNDKGDNNLKSLNIDGYGLEFNSNIYKYSILVDSNINELKIEAIPNSSKAKVIIKGNENFHYGNNEIVITVLAQNGSKSEYIIEVVKKSNKCVVKNIVVSGYELGFDCNTYNYELEIGFEDSLNVDVTTNNELSKVNVYNNSKLKHNDIVSVVVNLDGLDYKYNIKILKNSFVLEELFNNNQIIFIGGVLIITSGYIIGRRIYKRIKKNNSLAY